MVDTLNVTVSSVKKGEHVNQVQLRTLVILLAGCLVHCNAQWPGAIMGVTLVEYQAATVLQVGRERYTTMVVKNHKTGTTGSTKITLNGHLASHLSDGLANRMFCERYFLSSPVLDMNNVL